MTDSVNTGDQLTRWFNWSLTKWRSRQAVRLVTSH